MPNAQDQWVLTLDWREAELGSLKLIMARQDISDLQKLVLLRASWGLLYAHYEGFCKTALTIFFEQASQTVSNCGLLPPKTRLFALQNKLKELRTLPLPDMLTAVEGFSQANYPSGASFPEVDTKSNLWPSVLEELLELADISSIMLDHHRSKLNTLVSRRNKIAHGEDDKINKLEYYRGFEEAVYDIMYDLSINIDERLKRKPYI